MENVSTCLFSKSVVNSQGRNIIMIAFQKSEKYRRNRKYLLELLCWVFISFFNLFIEKWLKLWRMETDLKTNPENNLWRICRFYRLKIVVKNQLKCSFNYRSRSIKDCETSRNCVQISHVTDRQNRTFTICIGFKKWLLQETLDKSERRAGLCFLFH